MSACLLFVYLSILFSNSISKEDFCNVLILQKGQIYVTIVLQYPVFVKRECCRFNTSQDLFHLKRGEAAIFFPFDTLTASERQIYKRFGKEPDMGSTNELKVYAEYLMECELAARTQEIYLQEAEKLEKYLQNDTITKKKLLGYKELLEASGYAITTLNQRIIAANRYLRYLGYEDCALKTNRLQSRQSLNHMLTKKEYQILLDYAKESGREKYYALMRTLAMTGIRIGELKFFTVEILEKRVIQVTGKKKTREIYLPDKLIQELKTYCSHAGIEGGVIFREGQANRSTE